MRLSERLSVARGAEAPGPAASAPTALAAGVAHAQAQGTVRAAPEAPAAPGATRTATPPAAPAVASGHAGHAGQAAPAGPQSDALSRLKARVGETLFERMGARVNDPNLGEGDLLASARDILAEIVEAERVPLSTDERQRLVKEIGDDVLGYGPLQPLLEDPAVSEIMVNGPDSIFVERKGRLSLSGARFRSEEHLRQVIEKIVTRVGRRIDESSPLVDARLEDGSRVNAVIPPLAVNGSSLTIRKFAADPLKVADLVAFGSISPEMAELLDACVKAHLNIIVSGGTGTGKTTLLNVLSSFIPAGERIITIEDAVELQLQQDHVVRLESRPANIEGRGEITIRDLLKNSLRMRPDRIVVGECRSGEALDMLQAMNTGHDGSLSTVHANSPRDAVARLETLVLMAGMDLPLRAIREQISSAVDVIVQLTRLRDGTRRVTHVTEVHGMEGEIVTLQDVFVFDYAAGVDADGRFLGKPRPTGVRPRFTDRFDDLGIAVSPRVFGIEESSPWQR
jgi:pilus assembly protein CpaF